MGQLRHPRGFGSGAEQYCRDSLLNVLNLTQKLETDNPKIYRTVASLLWSAVLDSAVGMDGMCFPDQIGAIGGRGARFANNPRDFPLPDCDLHALAAGTDRRVLRGELMCLRSYA